MQSEELVPVADGIQLSAQRFGSLGRPAVLLIPGHATSLHCYGSLPQELGEAGFCAIVFDPRGMGLSVADGPLQPYTIDDVANDCAAILESLKYAPARLADGHRDVKRRVPRAEQMRSDARSPASPLSRAPRPRVQSSQGPGRR